MRVVFARSFIKAFDQLDSELAAKILKALALLESNPRHPSLHLKRVRSTAGVWEARVDLDYRMTLGIERDCYVMRNVGK